MLNDARSCVVDGWDGWMNAVTRELCTPSSSRIAVSESRDTKHLSTYLLILIPILNLNIKLRLRPGAIPAPTFGGAHGC